MNKQLESLAAARLENERETDLVAVMGQSLGHWKLACAELQKRLDAADEESCEWKTKFELQRDFNRFLEEREKSLSAKTERRKEFLRRFKDGAAFEDDDEEETDEAFVKKQITRMNRQIYDLESELKDIGWRIDQEAKAYTKVDEKRKLILNDVASARNKVVEAEVSKAKLAEEKAIKNVEKLMNAKMMKHARSGGSYAARAKKLSTLRRPVGRPRPNPGRSASPANAHRTPRNDESTQGRQRRTKETVTSDEQEDREEDTADDNIMLNAGRMRMNIPDERRVLDIRKGPVKKIAAVRRLPPIQRQDDEGRETDEELLSVSANVAQHESNEVAPPSIASESLEIDVKFGLTRVDDEDEPMC